MGRWFRRTGGRGQVTGGAGAKRSLTPRAAVLAAAVAVVLGLGIGTAYAQPVPMLTITPSSWTFGPVAVGQTASKTFVLTNAGGSATGALTIRVSGSPEFTITATTCRGALGPRMSCEVTVQFAPTPTTASTVAATLNVAGTRPEAMATAALTGTVAATGIPVDCSRGANLQTAINQAPPGATLAVTGTCFGNFTVGRNLTISGHNGATLNGDQQDSVLRINGASVTLNTLIITNGSASTGGGIDNGGGTVTLNGSTVTGNTARYGGGIWNGGSGTVTMNSASSVSNNTAVRYGGGIDDHGTVTMNGGTAVSNNTAGLDGSSS